MVKVLVVDDSPVDRRLVSGLLQAAHDVTVEYAENGADALNKMREAPPDVVLSDVVMPEMDGLQLVKSIRVLHPQVPVVLMTGLGSEDVAVAALEQGASNYVPKSQLADKLVDAVVNVLAVVRADRTYDQLIDCLDRTELNFHLANDVALIEPLVDLVQQMASGMKLCDTTGRYRLGMALTSALLNALYRGNLEIPFEAMQDSREGLLHGREDSLVEERRRQAPYNQRRIHVNILLVPEEARFVVRDEGPGFDVSRVPTAGIPGALEGQRGQGLLLMRTLMDEVRFNDRGNEVTMIKRREADPRWRAADRQPPST